MSKIDWTIIIGYPLELAIEYLNEENQKYEIITTTPPNKTHSDSSDDDLRIIGIRLNSDCLTLLCSAIDWSIN